jgi:hypothetical protein
MEAGVLPRACEHCPKFVGKPDRELAKLAS